MAPNPMEPKQGQGPKITMDQLKQGVGLQELLGSDQGRPLRDTFQSAYAELLAGFTEQKLTTEQVRSRYDELQGFLHLLDHMDVTISLAMANVQKHIAKTHVSELLGDHN